MNLGSGSLTKSGSGLWQLDAANNTMAGTTITAGTLQVNSSSDLGTGVLAFSGSGATLDILGSTAYSDTRAITLGADGTIQEDNTAGATLSGLISGGGALFKTGPGNLVLSNSTNGFGGTTVESGYLTVTTNGAIPPTGP